MPKTGIPQTLAKRLEARIEGKALCSHWPQQMHLAHGGHDET